MDWCWGPVDSCSLRGLVLGSCGFVKENQEHGRAEGEALGEVCVCLSRSFALSRSLSVSLSVSLSLSLSRLHVTYYGLEFTSGGLDVTLLKLQEQGTWLRGMRTGRRSHAPAGACWATRHRGHLAFLL